MKLPNGELAVVDVVKLRDYCLSTTHPRGKHKARLFLDALGMTIGDVDLLRSMLLEAASDYDAIATRRNEFGQPYEIEIAASKPPKSCTVLSVWIIRDDEGFPRLVTCYPL